MVLLALPLPTENGSGKGYNKTPHFLSYTKDLPPSFLWTIPLIVFHEKNEFEFSPCSKITTNLEHFVQIEIQYGGRYGTFYKKLIKDVKFHQNGTLLVQKVNIFMWLFISP